MSRREMLTKRLESNRRILESVRRDISRHRESEQRFQRLIAEDEAALAADTGGPITPDDLRYAATARCLCGAGMAYVKEGDVRGAWECSAILLGTPSTDVPHRESMPFAFYSVKSEDQPSAGGATTRP